jgi:hypothetical protein
LSGIFALLFILNDLPNAIDRAKNKNILLMSSFKTRC